MCPGLRRKGLSASFVRGEAVFIEDRVRAGMFVLSVHHTGEGRNGQLNEYLGAAMRVDDISKASGHCGMPAINVAVLTPIAVVLLGIHGFATYLSCRACWGRLGVRGCKMWWHESPGDEHLKTTVFCFIGFGVGL